MKTLLLIALTLTSVSAFAENCDEATSTYDIRQCQAREYEAADKKLNEVYGKLMKKLDKVGQNKLRKAQRAWIAYRDANCEFSADEMRGGTMETVILGGCHISMTNERTEELQDSVDFR